MDDDCDKDSFINDDSGLGNTGQLSTVEFIQEDDFEEPVIAAYRASVGKDEATDSVGVGPHSHVTEGDFRFENEGSLPHTKQEEDCEHAGRGPGTHDSTGRTQYYEDRCVPEVDLSGETSAQGGTELKQDEEADLLERTHSNQKSGPLVRPDTSPRPVSASAYMRSSTREAGSMHDGDSSFSGWDSRSPSVQSPKRRSNSANSTRNAGPSSKTVSRRPRSAVAGGYGRVRNMDEQLGRNPATWTPFEVCDWIDHINLSQYRHKFAHNSIDGALLLELRDTHMKYELGIGPLGHRYVLGEAIQQLREWWQREDGVGSVCSHRRPQSAPMERPRRPASAKSKIIPPDSHLGPSQGKITVFEQRAKLMFEIDRAQARAAHKHSLAWEMLRNAKIEEEEIKRLCGAVSHLENVHKLQFMPSDKVLDMDARVPWHPTGKKTNTRDPYPERIGKLRDHPKVEETFEPRINKESMSIMSSSQADGKSPSFLDRLRRDLRERERKAKEKKDKYKSISSSTPSKRENHDWKLVRDFFADKFGTELPDNSQEAIEIVHDTVEHYPSQLGLFEVQVDRILKKKGAHKIAAVAGAIHTLKFMERYRNEVKNRDNRRKSLQNKWFEHSSRTSSPKSKEEYDLSQCKKYFMMLGWTESCIDDSVTDDRLDALLKRVKYLKDARERNREEEVDWGKFSDGLADLQNNFNERELQQLEREAQLLSENQKPSAVDQTLGSTQNVHVTIDPSRMPRNWLMYTTKLLSNALSHDIDKLEKMSGLKKKVAVFRMIRTHKFLEFTADDLASRNKRTQEIYESLQPEKRVITADEAKNFFQRLMEDGIRRREKKERLIAEKKSKEEELARDLALKTAAGSKHRRPKSAPARR